MLRMLFALPFFLALSWWGGRKTQDKAPPPLTRKDWLGGVAGFYRLLPGKLWTSGLQYITASLERLILYLNPTLVLLLGFVLLAGVLLRPQTLGMAISYAGVLLVFGHEVTLQGADVALGAFLVFLSAVSYALYLYYSGEVVQRLGAPRLVGLATSVACLLCAICRDAATGRCVDGGPAGDLAVSAECHAVHGGARHAGHDGHRAHWLGPGGSGGHGRPDVHHADGRSVTLERAIYRLVGGGYVACHCWRVCV